ncbi:MAG TPA: hypothetical protein VF476_05955 [Chitinophagaceae bacterium]
MKKMLLLAIGGIFFIANCYAQLSKGQKMIGGEISFATSSNELNGFFANQKTTSFNIAPQIGFGLSKNWIAGFGLGYSHISQRSGSDYKQTANIFSVGAFARKFHPFSEKAGIFGELGAGVGFGKVEEKQNGFTEKTDLTNIAATLTPGFYFKANKRIILEANFGGLKYSHITGKDGNGDKSTNSEFSFQLTNVFGLGFQVVL